MKKDNSFLGILGWLSLLVGLLLFVILSLSFFRPFYSYEYRVGNQAAYIGMSDEGLMGSTETLLDYLQDKRQDIIYVTSVQGSEREVFNERETLHMVDVKNLYQGACTARNILIPLGILILVFFSYMQEKENRFSALKKTYGKALICLGIFVACILVWALIDFNGFWFQFHYLFFDNDLFILDPNTSIMINMFPERFFSDLVFLIIGVYAIILILLYVLLRVGDKHALKS